VAAFSPEPCVAAFSLEMCMAAFSSRACGGILLEAVCVDILFEGVCGDILLKSVCGASFVANTNEPLLKAGLTKGKPIPTEGQTPPANASELPPPRAPCPAYSILRRFKFCAGLRNLHASFCSTSTRRWLLLDTSAFCG